jgi:TetR/AcrR family transcriptional regulator
MGFTRAFGLSSLGRLVLNLPMAKKIIVTRNPERTRRQLLKAAITLFSKFGYHAVAVDQIVAAAKVNKRMVYHYYGSKEAIYQAALVDVYGLIEQVEFHAVQPGGTPRDKLTRLLESYFTFLDENPVFVRLLLWENLEKGKHITKHNHLLSKNPFLVQFREIVEEGIRLGQFRRDLDVTHLLIHFIGLCFIYHSNRFSLSQSLGLDLGDASIKATGRAQVLELVFGGICDLPKPPSK